jgi:23S rRNA-/tRNA-specific pseudouridylate synthase
MMLHAVEIQFFHPISDEKIKVNAPIFEQFSSLLSKF